MSDLRYYKRQTVTLQRDLNDCKRERAALERILRQQNKLMDHYRTMLGMKERLERVRRKK